MAENQVPHEAENASAPTNPSAPTSKRSIGKKAETSKKKPGTLSIRIDVDQEDALVLASVQLKRAGEEIHTVPQMVYQALERYMDYLQIKKGVEFLGVIPKKTSPAK